MHDLKNGYDLIFSIGEACSCSSTLRACNLQRFSYPLDWIAGMDFVGRCKLLTSDFDRFIEMEDLTYSYSEVNIACDAYYNTHNTLLFNHDFKAGLPLSETYPGVKEKYQRRINRLFSLINCASKILIVYIESPLTGHPTIPDESVFAGFELLKNRFKDKTVHVLYVSNSTEPSYDRMLNESIRRIQLDYKSKEKDALDHIVDFDILMKALEGYRLAVPLSVRIKKKLLRILIGCVPVSAQRKKLRKKYLVR